MVRPMRLHASCAALTGAGVLLMGKPGCGKSDLLLRLIDAGFDLVADDQVIVVDGKASAPAALAGLLEVRGCGIFRMPFVAAARVDIVVDLQATTDRLPEPRRHAALNLPMIHLDPAAASAVARVRLALGCARGRTSQLVGAFAA